MSAWMLGFASILGMGLTVGSILDEPVTLARTYKVGQVIRLRDNVVSKIGGSEGTQNSTVKKVVKEIKPNGDVRLSTVFEGGHLKSPLGEQDLPGGLLIDEEWSERGIPISWRRHAEADTFMAEEIRQTMVATSDVIFPDKPVRPGAMWQTVIDSPFIKGKKITYSTTFVGVETRNERQLWKVKQAASAELQTGTGNLKTDLTAWLDPKNGQLVRAEVAINTVPTQFGSMAWTAVTTVVSEK